MNGLSDIFEDVVIGDDLPESYDDDDSGEAFLPFLGVQNRNRGRGYTSPQIVNPGYRPYNPPPNVSMTSGVQTAQLQTPNGSATLRLPQEVAVRAEVEKTLNVVQEAIKKSAEIHQRDIGTLRKDMAELNTAHLNNVKTLRDETAQGLLKSKQWVNRRLRQLSRQQKSKEMNNLMITMLMQKQVQDKIDDHIDESTTAHNAQGSALTTSSSKDNSLLFLLPMMMMGQSGDGYGDDSNDSERGGFRDDDNGNMMMMMMMMLAMNDNK
jgi:hypothetical protein